MKAIRQMTDAELAAYVCAHLRRKGIEVILSGGACAAIYSNHQYVSMDLDLVNARFAKRRLIHEAMEELGFQERSRYFVHPDTEYLVEFPPAPLAVGEEPVQRIDELTLETGSLRILSPTDCVKDRLTWFYHSEDRNACSRRYGLPSGMRSTSRKSSAGPRRRGSLKHLRQFATGSRPRPRDSPTMPGNNRSDALNSPILSFPVFLRLLCLFASL